MTRSLHLWIDEPRLRGDSMVYAARLETPGTAARQTWLRVPHEYAPDVTDRADPFAILGVFPAMRARLPLSVHGEVSPSLLRNLEEFQAVWAAWRPDEYAPVEIRADVEREDPHPAPAARTVLAFSAGVDSAFSAWRHHERLCGRRARELTAAVMIHGYDVPVHDQERFDGSFRRARAMTQSIGLPLIPVATNYRDVEPAWEDVHGACVVACLALFAKSYGTGMLGSSDPYNAMVFPWASNPLTDRLLASDTFGVVHDGAEFDRVGKLRMLAGWNEAMENLLVCWEPGADGRNCGHCVKCIRTNLNFRVLGLPQPPAFARDVGVDDVRRIPLRILGQNSVNEFALLLRAADVAKLRAPWIAPLRRLVARHRLRARIGRTPVVAALRRALVATPAGQRVWAVMAGR